MQTFLPSSYSFSLDKLIDLRVYQSVTEEYKMHEAEYKFSLYMLVILVIIAIICGILYLICHNSTQKFQKNIVKIIVFLKPCIIFIPIIWLFIMIPVTYVQLKHSVKPIDYYQTAFFKLPMKSNFHVHTLDEHERPQSLYDHKQYPYKIYLDDSKKYSYYLEGEPSIESDEYLLYTGKPMKKFYIGMMKNGKFTPVDTDLGAIFYRYYVYITKHNLSQKFAKKMIFKLDGKYLFNNGSVQWVLTNDKDVVLHFDDIPNVKQGKVIEN